MSRHDKSATESTSISKSKSRQDKSVALSLQKLILLASEVVTSGQMDTPIVQGIPLIPIRRLPDRFRSLFPFPVFNAIQSKCFPHVYLHDYNVVLSAPTGSGKTVVMELAICRLVNVLSDGMFKVVYQAPTRSLCAERFRNWSTKFTCLGLMCAELTGDTDYAQLQSVQSASIIITTPEKWDSMTRKWRDHARLMRLIKLFLIDEVHVLNEDGRGAVLEAVVSRMKTVGSNVRFLALSATIPNSEDIATWLGRDATNQHLPAHRETFGEGFRPVKLEKFVYGYQWNGNDFVFDKVCGAKLPEVIAKHSTGKPIMIFCCTRNAAITTAKELANRWLEANPPRRLWQGGRNQSLIKNLDLRALINTGVAFHHAGLDSNDRHFVERGFLEGWISIICCTSTLAVGVNLPCHLVIVKNTVSWQEGGCREYSDLQMMQMLGRAGRPQFGDCAVAVILTKMERVQHYEKLISGTEQLESCLHLNLIDHINAEINLGTVTDLDTAAKWLAGTFLFVRMERNPTRYLLRENATRYDEDRMLREICERDIKLLQECDLVSSENKLTSTVFGDAMAKYYVKFETMKLLLALPERAKLSEILSALAQATEFNEIRFKYGEKSLYKEVNRDIGIRFPIRVNIEMQAHKISLLLQSELGGCNFPNNDQFQRLRPTFQQDKNFVFSHVNRLIRCVIDCQIKRKDAISVRNALELERSIASHAWDDSPMQMKQIEQIGVVAVRKLVAAGINCIYSLEETEPNRIEMILSKNPPFGVKVLARLSDFPKLRVTIRLKNKEIRPGKPIRITIQASIGFINERLPLFFQRRPVYVCFLAARSDGHLIDFRRMSARKLQHDHETLLDIILTAACQHITCYVMCDGIAGTLQYAILKPEIPESAFPPVIKELHQRKRPQLLINSSKKGTSGGLKGSFGQGLCTYLSNNGAVGKNIVADPDDLDWLLIDDFDDPPKSPQNQARERRTQEQRRRTALITDGVDESHEKGRWPCKHKCKDKQTCKHLCCRDGLDKPPRLPKTQTPQTLGTAPKGGIGQASNPKLILSLSLSESEIKKVGTKRKFSPDEEEIEWLDLTGTDLSLNPVRREMSFQKYSFPPRCQLSHDKASQLTQKREPRSDEYGDDAFEDIFSSIAVMPSLASHTQIAPDKKTSRWQGKMGALL